MRRTYQVNTTVTNGSDFLLRDSVPDTKESVSKAAFHDFYTASPVDIEIKMNQGGEFYSLSTNQSGFFRVEMAGVYDIRVSTAGTDVILQINGTDYNYG